MTIRAKVVAHTRHPLNLELKVPDLVTMELEYPRFIHAEFMTHRVFSRNASSSRAIPVAKMIEAVQKNPAMPVYWGKNQKGMQADEELSESQIAWAETDWLKARDYAVKQAERLLETGVHKQLANRILEPWCHIKVIVTSSQWSNFFALRLHKDAQPEMRALAQVMAAAMNGSTPNDSLGSRLGLHRPYVSELDVIRADEYMRENGMDTDHLGSILIKMSVARCARVSYLNHDGTEPDVVKDIELHDKLVASTPLHASPAEHQANADDWTGEGWRNKHQCGNFAPGWVQYRKMLDGECQ